MIREGENVLYSEDYEVSNCSMLERWIRSRISGEEPPCLHYLKRWWNINFVLPLICHSSIYLFITFKSESFAGAVRHNWENSLVASTDGNIAELLPVQPIPDTGGEGFPRQSVRQLLLEKCAKLVSVAPPRGQKSREGTEREINDTLDGTQQELLSSFGIRAPLLPEKVSELKEAYAVNPYPTTTEKQFLADRLTMTFKQVNNWFRWRRESERRAKKTWLYVSHSLEPSVDSVTAMVWW